mgnify:CR=1 FL=1|jgi:hypothetical protein
MEVRRLAVVKLIIIKLTVIKQIIMKPMVNQINHNKTGNSPCMTFIGNFLFIKIIYSCFRRFINPLSDSILQDRIRWEPRTD